MPFDEFKDTFVKMFRAPDLNRGCYHWTCGNKPNVFSDITYIAAFEYEWVIGSNDPDTVAEMEPEMTHLADFLDAVCPHITLRQYRNLLEKGIVWRGDYKSYGFGDDYTEYATKYISLNTLYKELQQMKIWG